MIKSGGRGDCCSAAVGGGAFVSKIMGSWWLLLLLFFGGCTNNINQQFSEAKEEDDGVVDIDDNNNNNSVDDDGCFTTTLCPNNATDFAESLLMSTTTTTTTTTTENNHEGSSGIPIPSTTTTTLKILAGADWILEPAAKAFSSMKDNVNVELITFPDGIYAYDLTIEDTINEAKSKSGLYDGFFVGSMVVGSIVDSQGWLDLRPYIDLEDWNDIMLGYRKYMSQYENQILMYPVDGDMLHLFYNKEILQHFGYNHPPRTWEEYNEISKTIHGQTYNNKTLSGSCVGRIKTEFAGYFWANLILSSITQTLGPWQGHMFDTSDMKPLIDGGVMDQLLEIMEGQVKYGHPKEFQSGMHELNYIALRNGECAMHYNWGDTFTTHLVGDSVLEGSKLGVARTPGSTHVLDRESMKLVPCTEDLCPYGIYYDDIGWVNNAPYLAFGGWGCAVNNYTTTYKKQLTAEFCAFAASKEFSLGQVIPNATLGVGGADPFRASHLNVDAWVENGYGRESTEEYLNNVRSGLNSDNVVLDIRFPGATAINEIFGDLIHDHLYATRMGKINADDLPAAREQIQIALEKEWGDTIANRDAETSTKFSTLESYQLLRGVYSVTVVYDDNLISDGILAFGYFVVAVSWTLSLSFLVWIIRNRRRNIVQLAQIEFLILICVGAIVSTSTLIALSFQAGTGESTTSASIGCQAAPFLYTIGWILMIGSIGSKTFRMYKIMRNCAEGKREVVTSGSTIKLVTVALCIDLAIVIAWTVTNPLVYKRDILEEYIDQQGVLHVYSIGRCSSEDEDGPNVWAFVAPLIVHHFFILVTTNVLLYKVRKVSDRYQERKYFGLAMLLMLEVLLVGVPILVAIPPNSNAIFCCLIGIIGIQDISILGFVFIPKVISREEITPKEKQEGSIIFASLKQMPTSKFSEGVSVIDSLLKPGNPIHEQLTKEQISQLTMVKRCLIQRDEKEMHVPPQLIMCAKENRKSRKPDLNYVLSEFAGVNSMDNLTRSFRTVSSVNSVEAPLLPEEAGFYIIPEFQELNGPQKMNLFRLLSWSNLKRWDFNVFDVLRVTGSNPLLIVGWAVLGSPYSQYSMARDLGQEDVRMGDFKGYNFMRSSLKPPLKKLCDYLRVVESDYKADNPYHNAIHAADVVQTLHSLIQMKRDAFDNTAELFSILLAAAVHDVNHPGKNNAFQVNAVTDLALYYNDTSVLENKHASHAFMLMLGRITDQPELDDLNFLSELKPSEFASIRKKVVDAVLHTDMSKHFISVDAVKGMINQSSVGDVFSSSKSRWNLLMFMLHLADISNPAKRDPVFKIWTDRCLDEFFEQGDTEAEMGLPVSPNCNRNTTEKAGSQIGFINFVIKPAYEVLGLVIPQVQEHILPIIQSNLEYWQCQQEKKESA